MGLYFYECLCYALFTLACILSLPAHAQPSKEANVPFQAATNPFQTGLESYNKQAFQQAKMLFQKALKQQPNNSQILYNIGLAHYKLGEKGLALGYWRRALYLAPFFSMPRSAIARIYADMDTDLSWHSSYFWDLLRVFLLSYTDIEVLWILSSLLVLATALKLIPFFGQRHLSSDDYLTPFEWTKYSLGIFAGLALLVFLSLAKTYDYYHPRATVVVALLPIKIAPHEDDNTLAELSEGFEVQLKKTYDSWVQITSPKGLTGWVPKKTLLQTTGQQLW